MALNSVSVTRSLTILLKDFLQKESASGFLLVGCTVLSLLLANSPVGRSYLHVWHVPLAGQALEYWINDGFMAIFFLLVGLEIKRELMVGELSQWRAAMLPVFAALGGMICPALLHLSLNIGTPTQAGSGIPMATDIAFALGALMLLGKRVPLSLKVFLTALAIIDDLGAIVVIATFYSTGLSLLYLSAAAGIFVVLAGLGRLKVHHPAPYVLLGVVAWYCMLHSGIHATIAGVVLAFVLPFGDGSPASLSYRVQHGLHKPVAFLILPLFALANTGIVIPSGWVEGLASANSLGIMAGLLLGKPVGIFLFSVLAIRLGLCTLPADLTRWHVLAAGMLGGIGFTMSVFIALLAFADPALLVASKIAIMVSSVVAAGLGVAGLGWMGRDKGRGINE